MHDLLLYLLKVSVGTALLYISYLLLFRKDTFYFRNRIFLILVLLLPIVFPALRLPVSINRLVPGEPAITGINIVLSESTLAPTLSPATNSSDYASILIFLYFIVTGILLLRVFISLISTYRIITRGTIKNNQFPKVVISGDQITPFSFFPYAVIPIGEYGSGNYTDLLDHESVHVRQGHTFDLLLIELFMAFQWFNPFVWLIRRSIVLNHEYLADKVSLINTRSVKEYQYRLLNFQSGKKNISLVHSFNSLIKNRIIMINRKPTQKYATLKNIIILPVLALIVYAFAAPENRLVAANQQEQLLSGSSEASILKFIGMNTGYPQEARNSSDTGKVFVVVKIEKGGKIKECKAYKETTGIKVPFLHQVVIVGYKSSAAPGDLRPGQTSGKTTGNGMAALQTECVRVSNKLGEVDIPEWKDKNMEFALVFNFQLK